MTTPTPDAEADDNALLWAIIAAINTSGESSRLVARLRSIRSQLSSALSERDAALARASRLDAALRRIAYRDDGEMATAVTLHYDMRGWAVAALSAAATEAKD